MNGLRLITTLLSPVTGLGFLIAIFWQVARLRHERKVFNTAIDRHATGLWAGLIGGIGVALIVSLAALGLGLMVPKAVWLAISGLGVAALVLSFFGFAPWYLGLAGVVANLLEAPQSGWQWQLIALVALLWLAESVVLHLIDPPIDVPTIKLGKRGADIAVYDHRQLYWLPLVLPISGSTFASLPWWTTLHVGAAHFALIGLPVIIGAMLRTKKQLPQHATHQWAIQYLIAGAVAAALAAATAWLPQYSAYALWILATLGIMVAIANRWALRAGSNYISQTSSGVRIVAVLPETPAAAMGLVAGDIVLLCNTQPVHQAAELYAAIQEHPTYCRLRVQRLDGEIKLCETAIFEGAPHTLGMITFAEELAK